ncbi:hypothetical protein GCM10022288_23620 [Gryllotalpicola kribbensis]|uniref:Pyridoxamine 5'-phosphate oxidase-like domain-containing protein n=1 Tax=Gryllotalpicola kribbensis TaxID=993084 RepID=A0ABP8AW53_9MICO
MALSPDDLRVIDDMKQREFTQKKRRRAVSAMHRERTRFRALLSTLITVVVAVVVGLGYAAVRGLFGAPLVEFWDNDWLALVIGAVIGWLLGELWFRSASGRRVLTGKDARLNQKYSGDLHAGRRWQQFFYRGEEISALIPRALYTLESHPNEYESLDAVLAEVRATRYENPRFRARGQELFNSLTDATDLVILSTVDEFGRPSSRFMRFVTTERPGVWYVTSAPEAPKIPEFDRGQAALLTVPTENGATISSNRVHVRRASKGFAEIADFYRAQVPRYLDGMTSEDQAREIVYEVIIESARVSSWEYNEPVLFENNRAPV